MPRLSNEQFISILNAQDLAVLSIRGHVAIEAVLGEVIRHALPDPHQIEVERLSFPFKVDLAIALKGLNKDSRSLFLKLNSIRNRFAHQATAELDGPSAVELKSCMAIIHRTLVGEHFEKSKNPRSILRIATAAAFYEACGVAENLLSKKLEREAWLEEVTILLKETEKYSTQTNTGEFTRRLQARVEAKKKLDNDKPS